MVHCKRQRQHVKHAEKQPVEHLSVKTVILTAPIRFYRRFISPLLPPTCRFYPTCSQYAVEALERYGLFRGCWLILKRLSKCHPYHPGGFDPLK